ncbi:MAG TPA: histidine kinase [Chitinophagales bacterium]|nr:histidine kinase [Chitinophagales bacterium]
MKPARLFSNNNPALHIAIWMGITAITAMLLTSIMEPEFAVIRAILLTGMLITVHYINAFIFNRTIPQGKTNTYLLAVLGLLIVLSLSRLLLEWLVLPSQTQPLFYRNNAFRPLLFIFTTVIAWFISTIVLYAIYLTRKEQQLLQAINQHQHARLQYLQSHINPHFLFNALNNLYSQVITRNDNAPETLLMLTNLLRYAVYQKPEGRVSVNEEATQIDLLIKLFAQRRTEPYNIVFKKTGNTGSIEPMILVPLAENCLKHCDFDLNENAYVKMGLNANVTGITFETENTFNPAQVKNADGGVGLQNIRERLELIYGDKADIEVTQENNIFRVRLHIQWSN